MTGFDDQVRWVPFIHFWHSSSIFGTLTLSLKFYLWQNVACIWTMQQFFLSAVISPFLLSLSIPFCCLFFLVGT